jgi:hypothetical protein
MDDREQKDAMDKMFRFKIGDIVEHIAVPVPEPKKDGESEGAAWGREYKRPDVKYCVLERIVQQCHGGVQRHYQLRIVGTKTGAVPGRESIIQLSEFEVRAAS